MASTTDILALARECGGVETTVAGSGQKRIFFPVEQLAVFASRLQQGDAEMRAALTLAVDHLDMDALRISHCKDAAIIDAARQSSAGGEGQ